MTTKTSDTGRTGKAGKTSRSSRADAFRPLLVDVAVPIGSYYLLKEAFGASTFAALAWSSLVPAVRTGWSTVRERRTNPLSALILLVNVVSLVLGFVSGDPRLMLAKDSGVSSVIGIGILVSVALDRPMMTAAVKAFVVKGDAVREAAWQRLASGAAVRAAVFRRKERLFSLVWGVALLGECVARVVGAYTVPVDTMVWLGSVIMAGVMAVTFVVSGRLAARPMERLLAAESESTGLESAQSESAEPKAGRVVPEVAFAAA
ncbi:VC0807 family protein [Streptomyces sp. H51]|uniref:VC0807 family protein n=1 Tax=Streptomyces sp. H51 TaxID=3111770 RepID=UPI002D77B0DE|nr:VC0807 family protein [Streptomyces sp. H51]